MQPILSPAQRSALRAQAHALKPVVIIGTQGLTDAVLVEAECHLVAHELIKIRVFSDDREERNAFYAALCERLHAAPVQHIGKLLVLYRAKPVAHPELPSARQVLQGADNPGRAPRIVKVRRVTNATSTRRPKVERLVVRGHERVTAGGLVKRAKKRQASVKRQHRGEG
jgi:putative YhbY family RNA-binding protein